MTACLVVVFALSAVQADDAPGKQTRKKFETDKPSQISVEYWLSLPADYEQEKGTKSWPLMLFLHGAGERGTNLDVVKKHGPPKLAETREFPFIIVSPQCPNG